jgi:hypothetical protein
MAEAEFRYANRPIELKGVINGKTITLDEETFLPDEYRITLHLILEPEEAIRLSSGAWANMTPEEVADFEATVSELEGRPFKMPEPENSRKDSRPTSGRKRS